jgi:hypothetical protein
VKRTILLLLGLVLFAAIVVGSIEIVDYYERDGRSPYEKWEDEAAQERAEGEDTFPLTTPASRDRFVALYCLYMARSRDQLRRCSRRPPREVYRSKDDEFAWLFASEVIDYCEGGGRFCDPADVDGPIMRVARLTGGQRG